MGRTENASRSSSMPNRNSRRNSINTGVRSRNSSPSVLSPSMSQMVMSEKNISKKKVPKMLPVWELFTFHSLTQTEAEGGEESSQLNTRVSKNYECKKCKEVRIFLILIVLLASNYSFRASFMVP